MRRICRMLCYAAPVTPLRSRYERGVASLNPTLSCSLRIDWVRFLFQESNRTVIHYRDNWT